MPLVQSFSMEREQNTLSSSHAGALLPKFYHNNVLAFSDMKHNEILGFLIVLNIKGRYSRSIAMLVYYTKTNTSLLVP